ncbi:unnamed protein product [Phytophthora fragariaefolia]|uniref:Unnamed protein product n=1 Tax=Phytophthora fragariaefolia TaxID=1490495 RepID=A0A9W6XG76_9STRA|nr:unnamed protein product [Phytophthora fragariaefolia]
MTEYQDTILRVFKKRFDKLKYTDLEWIAYLDPRIAKTMSHVTPDRAQHTRKRFLNAVMELGDVSTMSQQAPKEPMTSPDPVLDRMFGRSQTDDRSPLRKKCSEEIDKYLDAANALVVPQKTEDFDTLAWWSVNRATYPNISKLARKWLSAVATSVSSERAFSTSGNIVTAKRSSLAPDIVRDLVFIAENSRRMKKLNNFK